MLPKSAAITGQQDEIVPIEGHASAAARSTLKEWAAFAAAGIFWGSSFLWIKVALREVDPFALVAFRVLFGVFGLLVAMRFMGLKFPRDPRTLKSVAVMAILNPTIPFILISWGETRIDAGVASILNGTVPFFTILVARLLLPEERVTRSHVAGFVAGFAGVLLLVSKGLSLEAMRGGVWGQLAVLTAALFYGISTVYTRIRLKHLHPIVQAASVMVVADMVLWALVAVNHQAFVIPRLPLTWLALVWMGLFGTCVAFISYFYLIGVWGCTRAAVVNYLFPVVGLLLGIGFLGESVDWRLFAGGLLVLSGVLLVNLKGLKDLKDRRSHVKTKECLSENFSLPTEAKSPFASRERAGEWVSKQ